MESVESRLGIGLYTFPEAARLLGKNAGSVRRWANGYTYALRTGRARGGPVLGERPDEEALSFGELIELLHVKGFREHDVSLESIRQAAASLREEWRTPYPFATRRVATSGNRLLAMLDGEWKEPVSGQKPLAFVDELAEQMIYSDDFTTGWRPLGPEGRVLLDPKRRFGKPIDPVSGIRTAMLSDAFVAEEDPVAVARIYEVDLRAVEDAVRFERAYAA